MDIGSRQKVAGDSGGLEFVIIFGPKKEPSRVTAKLAVTRFVVFLSRKKTILSRERLKLLFKQHCEPQRGCIVLKVGPPLVLPALQEMTVDPVNSPFVF